MSNRCVFAAQLIVCALLSAAHSRCRSAVDSDPTRGTTVAREGSSGQSADRAMMDDPEALAVAARHPRLAGRTLIALAEARVGTRSALIVWPLFDASSSRPVSDDPVGVTLELGSDGTLTALSAGWNPRDRTGRALSLQLGTEQFERVDRSEGAPIEALPSRISAAFDGFRAACAAGDRAAATRAARAMASLFAWDVLAYEDVVTEMLWAASTGDYQLAHGATTMLDDGRRARVTAVITYRGTAHTITVIATPRPAAPDRWVITSAAD